MQIPASWQVVATGITLPETQFAPENRPKTPKIMGILANPPKATPPKK